MRIACSCERQRWRRIAHLDGRRVNCIVCANAYSSKYACRFGVCVCANNKLCAQTFWMSYCNEWRSTVCFIFEFWFFLLLHFSILDLTFRTLRKMRPVWTLAKYAHIHSARVVRWIAAAIAVATKICTMNERIVWCLFNFNAKIFVFQFFGSRRETSHLFKQHMCVWRR